MTRQEAIKLLIPLRNSMVDQYGCPISDVVFALDVAIDVLEQEPIIYCKDCKHWGGVIFGNKCTMLSGLDYVIGTKENDFCSFAERMESDEK